MMLAVALVSLLCALVPAVMMMINLRLYVAPPPVVDASLPAVSILIPARNEAHGIEDAVHAALTTRGIEFEIVVLDDGSTDGTDARVQAMAAQDPLVRLERAPALPAGWNGKQHACWALAHAARHPVFCFVDADVRLGPECVARMAGFLGGNALVSGFPRQITITWMEWLLLPLIHFVLLGFLPIAGMRGGTDPAYAAGCGQFVMARREAYFACGGHSGIKLTMHDGLRLPKLFRMAGYRTDLADITKFAACRMYSSASEVWSGLAKNATEGLADPKRIVPVTVLLLLGQVLPFGPLLIVLSFPLLGIILGALGMDVHISNPVQLAVLALSFGVSICAIWTVRAVCAVRFKQDWRSALLHPVGITLLLAVQWYALTRKLWGGKISWRGRAYAGD